MRVHRLTLADTPAEAYDRLVSDSFYASRGFLDVWRTMGGRPVVWMAELDGRMAAALPGVEYGLGPLKRFASLPDGCYGGLFADPDLGEHRALDVGVLDAIARHGYAKCYLFDRAGVTDRHPGFASETRETLRVDISGPDWAPRHPSLRSQIRMAQREGIRIEPFEWERHHAGFLELVATTARRQGIRPRYRARLYECLARLATTDARVRWRYCEHGGRPAASHIYFIDRGTLVSWQDYFDKTFSFLKPNPYIRWDVCREAAREGIRWLDLGATPAHADGVAIYKSRWGGEPAVTMTHSRWGGIGALVRPLREPGPTAALEPVAGGDGSGRPRR